MKKVKVADTYDPEGNVIRWRMEDAPEYTKPKKEEILVLKEQTED